MRASFTVIPTVVIVPALLAGACTLYAQKQNGCSILNVYDANSFSKGHKIAVGVFEVGGAGVGSNAGPLEKPREILLDRFQKDLKKTKYFSAVSVVAADMSSDADYILEGDLIGLNGGSRFGRIFVGGFGSLGQMRVSGRILGPAPKSTDPARRVLSDWECNVFTGGKWGTEGNESMARRDAAFFRTHCVSKSRVCSAAKRAKPDSTICSPKLSQTPTNPPLRARPKREIVHGATNRNGSPRTTTTRSKASSSEAARSDPGELMSYGLRKQLIAHTKSCFPR
jgi:hypothetical protein